MKKFLFLLMASALMWGLAAGLTACAPQAEAPAAGPERSTAPASPAPAEDRPLILVYAEMNPLDTIVGRMGMFFKEKVAELSNGIITVDVQSNSVLGSETDILEGMLSGGTSVDMTRISAFALTSHGAKKSMLLSLPYTFASREHFWNFANSALAPEFLNEPQELGLGLRGVFYGEEGFRHFFAVKEMTGVQDMSGMKLRVSNDPIMNGLVEGLGSTPSAVAFGDLYSALNTHTVDGAEQPIANYYSNAFHEVAPYLILDGHTLGAVQVVISDSGWNKLTPNQQNIIMEAGKLAQEYCASISASAESEVLEKLKAEGTTIVDVPDNAEWAAACQQVISDNAGARAELYQQILDMK